MTDPLNPNHDEPAEGPRDAPTRRRPARIRAQGRRGRRRGERERQGQREVSSQIRSRSRTSPRRPRPTVREFSAKAAELVAVAADKAAPIAHKAGEATAGASSKLAESRGAGPPTSASRSVGATRAAQPTTARGRRTEATSRPRTSARGQPAALDPRRAPGIDHGRSPIYFARDVRPTHRHARRSTAAPEGQAGRFVRQVPSRAARRPRAHDARRAGRGPGRAAARRGDAGRASSRSRTTSTSSSTRASCARPETTAISKAACRSRATWPTSSGGRRSGSSPRTARARSSRCAGSGLLGRALQHELDHLDGKLYIDYLDSMDELIPVGQGDEDDAEVREATSALA